MKTLKPNLKDQVKKNFNGYKDAKELLKTATDPSEYISLNIKTNLNARTATDKQKYKLPLSEPEKNYLINFVKDIDKKLKTTPNNILYGAEIIYRKGFREAKTESFDTLEKMIYRIKKL